MWRISEIIEMWRLSLGSNQAARRHGGGDSLAQRHLMA